MADGVTFDSSEVIELQARLQQSPARVRQLASVAVRKAGQDIERDAKVAAPVDTGYLRSSITARMSGNANTSSVQVSAGANYAPFVEFGTSRMAPQPFLIPAFDRHKEVFKQALQQLASGALG